MVHHLCINEDHCVFDGKPLPFGKQAIEQEITKVINEILDEVVKQVGDDDVVVCGVGDARRMLGRKLEDRLKREVMYE